MTIAVSGPHVEDGTNARGRWSDLVDMAGLVVGRGYLGWDEIDHVLWERTCWPLGTPDIVWPQLLDALVGQEDPP